MKQTSVAYIFSGITSVLVNALLVISIITLLIQFYALKNYIQNRMYDFKTLLLLGVKKQEIYKCMRYLLIISLLIFMIFLLRKLQYFYHNSLGLFLLLFQF